MDDGRSYRTSKTGMTGRSGKTAMTGRTGKTTKTTKTSATNRSTMSNVSGKTMRTLASSASRVSTIGSRWGASQNEKKKTNPVGGLPRELSGQAYKSNRAAGDVARKGALEPFAYIPLNPASLSRRRRAGAEIHGSVRAAMGSTMDAGSKKGSKAKRQRR